MVNAVRARNGLSLKENFDTVLERLAISLDYRYLESMGQALGKACQATLNFFDPRTYAQMVRQFGEKGAGAYLVAIGERKPEEEFPTVTGFIQRPQEMLKREVRLAQGSWMDLAVWATNFHQAFDSFVNSFAPAIPAGAALAFGLGPAIARGTTLPEFVSSSVSLVREGARGVGRGIDVAGRKIFGDPLPPAALTTAGCSMPIPMVKEEVAVAVAMGDPVGVGSKVLLGPLAGAVFRSGSTPSGGATAIELSDLSSKINDIERTDGLLRTPRKRSKFRRLMRRLLDDARSERVGIARSESGEITSIVWGPKRAEASQLSDYLLSNAERLGFDRDSLLLYAREIVPPIPTPSPNW